MEIEAFLKDPSASRLTEILAQDGAVAALDEARVLGRLLSDAWERHVDRDGDGCAVRIALVPVLIDAGVDVNRTAPNGVSALAITVGLEALSAQQQVKLMRQLLAAGADPQLRDAGPLAHWASAAGMLERNPGRIRTLRPLLEPVLTDDGRIDALVTLLTRYRHFQGYPEVNAWLADMAATAGRLDAMGADGLALLHLAALTGDIDLLRDVLAKTREPGVAVAGGGRLSVEYAGTVRYTPGMTAVDLIDRTLHELTLKTQVTASSEEKARAFAERLTQCRAALIQAGVPATAAPPSRPAIRSMDLMRDQWLAADLVVGKHFTGDLGLEALESMSEDMDGLAQRLGVPLVVLYLGQADSSLPAYATCVVGLHVARAEDASLTAIAYQDLVRLVDQARTLPWDEIAEQLPEGDLRNSLISHEDAPVEVYGCGVGSVAGFTIGFGVVVELPEDNDEDQDEDEEDWDEEDWDDEELIAEILNRPDGLARVTPDLEVFQGWDAGGTNGKPVYGVHMESARYYHVPCAVDFSAEAHAERVAKLGALADRATYYLSTIFD